VKYCTRCFYPDTKPDLWFNENGLCAACIAFDGRKEIDWQAREKEFADICNDLRGTSGYHCIVPVSGGKDSTIQVLKCVEYGLTVLAVCASTDDLTPLGRRNLDNIKNLGVDLIEVSINAKVRKNLARYSLETIGDISWAEHNTIFTIPFKEAAIRGIPYIFWGENSQNEYGGPEESQGTKELTTSWIHEFGGFGGLRTQDVLDDAVAIDSDLLQFSVRTTQHSTQSLFMGYYFPWGGRDNALLAREHGFRWNLTPVQGSGVEYENLDNYQTGIHDYFKYIKYGFGRATDIVSNGIRRGTYSREQGRELVKCWDGNYGIPPGYLGQSFDDTIEKIGMKQEQYYSCVKKFANKELFQYVGNGLVKPLFLRDLYDA
jgi:N-acetyl sugar amidotransferase